ncbi:hypothetical protein [Clostridium tagluense]|nr:hypothetical protein [Clostridium tagluense]MCB2310201.1 hypothetical protein [Clostridium tagluense]MCB2315157.1 hypothetical protein [Clostridium tagluense]MCB2324900.1 hypothetical protein [Clostridium tagluense]MCB2329646.1 hypothetical protein [Clostridium tagluense]WAG51586.1 hypothetical protein LL095_04850 [Clostridium tagluense]
MIEKWFKESTTDKKYETELLEKGINDIVKLAIVFKEKEIKVTQGNIR